MNLVPPPFAELEGGTAPPRGRYKSRSRGAPHLLALASGF